MPVGSAASQMLRNDTTKTKVDTIQLKKDIDSDSKKIANKAKLAGDLDKSTGNKSQGNSTMPSQLDLDALVSKQRQLEDARKRKKP